VRVFFSCWQCQRRPQLSRKSLATDRANLGPSNRHSSIQSHSAREKCLLMTECEILSSFSRASMGAETLLSWSFRPLHHIPWPSLFERP
jgi:hypothetical protein